MSLPVDYCNTDTKAVSPCEPSFPVCVDTYALFIKKSASAIVMQRKDASHVDGVLMVRMHAQNGTDDDAADLPKLTSAQDSLMNPSI